MLFTLYMHGSRGASVKRKVTGQGRYVRQMGPPGRFGVIDLILEPAEDVYSACALSWEVSEAQIPLRYLDGVISGIKHVLSEARCSADYLHGTRIRVVDGAYNSTDSKISCYLMATVIALRVALSDVDLYSAPSGPSETIPT